MRDAERWLADQEELVARWQLLDAGWHRRQVERWVARTRPRVVHPGVYAVQRSPLRDPSAGAPRR